MSIIKQDYGTLSGGNVQYALSFSNYLSGSAGAYIGFLFDTEGNTVYNTAGTTDNDYVTVVMSGSASSTSLSITAKKSGYYNILGRKFVNGGNVPILIREYKNIGDTIFSYSDSYETRCLYIMIWLEA